MVNRIDPGLPVGAMQTYAILSPHDTHTRVATCEEVACVAQCGGWITNVDVGTDLGQKQSFYIRVHSGRHFKLSQAGTMQTFEFPPGEKCFREHRVSLDRPELFVKRGGDWRAQTSESVTMRPADWVDDFATHQDNIATLIHRG